MYDTLKRVIKFLGIFSIILTLLCLVYLFKHLDILNNPHALADALRGHLFWGSIIFLLLQIIQVIIPIIPGGVTTVVGFMALVQYWALFSIMLALLLGVLFFFY